MDMPNRVLSQLEKKRCNARRVPAVARPSLRPPDDGVTFTSYAAACTRRMCRSAKENVVVDGDAFGEPRTRRLYREMSEKASVPRLPLSRLPVLAPGSPSMMIERVYCRSSRGRPWWQVYDYAERLS